ncbi:polysaccharide biosynthesis tyrosine autokinase [Actinomycetospora sp. NBC_00405]|uniref:polysaccharide biosynthesis tyrosine autokinase n=1 Tax=Actinomycetospora sp. NBC_00405 TaxID=2975952 RepID=UPI002E1CED43
MTIQKAAEAIRRRYTLVVLALIIGILASSAIALLRPLAYESTARLYVAAQVGDSADAVYQGSLVTEQRVTSYIDLLTSDRVLAATLERLQLTASPEDLRDRVTATNAPGSVLIDVEATAPTAPDAARLAETVSAVFIDLVNEIERPAQPGRIQPVAVRVVQPATVPSDPISLPVAAIIGIGVFVGLAVGIGTALLVDSLDRTVRDAEQLSNVAGVPNLGEIPFVSNASRRSLLLDDQAPPSWSESLRQLRTNLQYVNLDRPPKTICVTSAVEGEGKTTTAINLAIASSLSGNRVLLIDGDLRRPSVASVLGLEEKVGLTSVLAGRVPAEQATQVWSSRLRAITSGPTPPNPSEILGSGQMSSLIAGLHRNYDLIVIDTPPVLPVTDAVALSPSVDGVLVVSRAGKTTTSQIDSAVKALQNVSANILGTVRTLVGTAELKKHGRYQSSYHDTANAATLDDSLAPRSARSLADARRPSPGPRNA